MGHEVHLCHSEFYRLNDKTTSVLTLRTSFLGNNEVPLSRKILQQNLCVLIQSISFSPVHSTYDKLLIAEIHRDRKIQHLLTRIWTHLKRCLICMLAPLYMELYFETEVTMKYFRNVVWIKSGTKKRFRLQFLIDSNVWNYYQSFSFI